MADVKIEGFTLHTHAKGIDRELEAMFSKAMCAYANLKTLRANAKQFIDEHDYPAYKVAEAACQSEHEATVRCINMFVRESLYDIQYMVAEAAIEEFDL